MQCPNCGAPASAGELFCGECGARLGAPQPPRPAAPYPPRPAPPPPPARSQNGCLMFSLGCGAGIILSCLVAFASATGLIYLAQDPAFMQQLESFINSLTR